ncbi:MAG: hypothetical protein H7257_02320, partial [Taibaiella sp.]|nr:hypothetical protein [Taibaiella sp.]
ISIPDSNNLYDDSFISIYATCLIDTDGDFSKADYNKFGDDIYYRDEIRNIIKAMPKWKPAYERNMKTGKIRLMKMPGGFEIKYYYKSKKPK